MKNRRALLFALVLGISAVFLVAVYLTNIEKHFRDTNQPTPIWVAKKDIARYQKIDETMIERRIVPRPYLQPLAVKEEEVNLLIGAMADSTIKQGEQITQTKLALAGEGGVSPIIPPNYRACTISVNDISGVGGLIRNGDFVDVIGLFRRANDKGQAVDLEATTLFQNVPVLSVGKNYLFDRTSPAGQERTGILPMHSGGGVSFSDVTVQMSPRECMDLAVAQSVGEITLMLRSYHDRFGGKVLPELKEKRSTKESVTGIKERIEISRRPRWLELRGPEGTFVP